MYSEHGQRDYAVRCDWGPTGAAAIAAGADVAVVVDVLSFTTTLSVACSRGITVLPYRWRDEKAAAYAEAHDAVLAVGRLESRSLGEAGRVAASLSPSGMAGLAPGALPRVVLPSPNGSSICFGLRDAGLTVVGACLRNRSAVARWLAPLLAAGQTLAVVAAGERWPDDSLRPAAEDLWGAGAVLAALVGLDISGLSPEAETAIAAYEAVAHQLGAALLGCASGRELAAVDFPDDVEVAAELDADSVVPVLTGTEFSTSPARSGGQETGESG